MTYFKSKPLACAFALAFSVSLAGCEMMSTASTYEDAQSAFEDGQYRIANAHLIDILASGEADTKVRKLQLDLMLTLGDGNRAMAALEQLSQEDLSGAERRIALAHAQILQGAPGKTVEIYEALARDKFTEQDYRMALWAVSELGEMEDFTSGMDFALESYPDSPQLNALAANQLFDLGMGDAAQPFVATAVENGPDVFEAQLVAGRGEIFKGELEKAIEHYQLAHEINKINALPLTNIAGLYMDLDQLDEAQSVLDQAVQNHGDFPFLQWQLARYKLATGDVQGAREARDRVARIFADRPNFMILSGQIEEEMGNRSLALDGYRRFVREYGEVPEVMEKIAELEG